jgi:hypothetical protein
MEMAAYCLFALLAAFVGFLALIARAQAQRQRSMDQARANYRAALAELQALPGDERRRQRALDTGRHYAKVAREQQAPMIFDEAALARDLDAVTAGGLVVGPSRPATGPRRQPPDEPPGHGLDREDEQAPPRERAVGGE